MTLMVLAVLFTVNTPISNSAQSFKVKGELLGKINHLEAQGWTLSAVNYAQIFYLIQPTPPYINANISVQLQLIQCTGETGPCVLLGTATITAEEWVVNDNGNKVLKNVSDAFIAL